jgi:serine/threonine protein kinase
MYILLTGYLPFYEEDEKALIKRIKTGKFDTSFPEWKVMSDEAKDLISSLLQVNP